MSLPKMEKELTDMTVDELLYASGSAMNSVKYYREMADEYADRVVELKAALISRIRLTDEVPA